jgi:hypothetical protein
MLDASRFFKEAFRSRLVKDMRDGVEDPPTGKRLEEQLRAGIPVEVPSHWICPTLYESAAGLSVTSELGSARRSILVIQVGPTGSVRSDLVTEVRRWQEAGKDVETAGVRGEEEWWLVHDQYYDEGNRPLTQEIFSITERWIETHASQGGSE